MPSTDRRSFVKSTAAVAAASSVAPFAIGAPRGRRALDMVNIGVVGTGGRGTGACNDSLSINPNVRLVAMGNLHADKAKTRRDQLKQAHGDRVDVPDSRVFGGLEAFEQVINHPDVDVVLLTTSPGFRPQHLEMAVKARKHVFAEKPTCLDPAGWHACVRAHEQAERQGTAIVTGTQYRRQTNYLGAIEKIREGMIGEVVGMTGRYCSTGIWYRPRVEGETDAEYQLKNWMHFIWLSGDQICEQAVHNVDVMNWVMDAVPDRAYASGGRFTRPADSEMWDSMSVDFEYPGNRLVSFTCRQIPGAAVDVDNVVYGSKGTAYIRAINGGSRITDRDGNELWKMDGSIGKAYQQEHKDLIDSVVAGKPIVELKTTADSSLTAAMGRVAAYTGQKVTWDFMTRESRLDTFPKDLSLDSALPSPGHAIPAQVELV